MPQDLIFQYPWNNFLHSVVYDVIHQILFGRVEGQASQNRELVIGLFRDVKLPTRIVDGIRRNELYVHHPVTGFM